MPAPSCQTIVTGKFMFWLPPHAPESNPTDMLAETLRLKTRFLVVENPSASIRWKKNSLTSAIGVSRSIASLDGKCLFFRSAARASSRGPIELSESIACAKRRSAGWSGNEGGTPSISRPSAISSSTRDLYTAAPNLLSVTTTCPRHATHSLAASSQHSRTEPFSKPRVSQREITSS